MAENQEIISAVLAGDRDRYAELVRRYADRAQAIAYSHLKDVQAAEDVAQEAFIKAYTSLRTLTKPEAFGAWLGQITRNLSRTVLRKKRIAVEPLDSHPERPDSKSQSPRHLAEQKETADSLREALDQIPSRIRETIVLFYFKDLSISQIAEVLGISENSVKQRLHRGRIKLRRQLEQTVEQELKHLKPSDHFVPAVLLALPSEPVNLGALGKFFAHLAAFPAMSFWALPLLIFLVTNRVAYGLILSDMDPARPEHRKSHKRLSRKMTMVMLLTIIGVWGLSELSEWFPILGVVWIMFPFLLVLPLRRTILIVFPTWGSRLGMIGLIGAYVSIGLIFFFPARSDDFQFWISLFMIPMLWGISSSVDVLQGGPTKQDHAADGSKPAFKPVPLEFLKETAHAFARMLNTPLAIFSKVEIEKDCVCFSNTNAPWLIRAILPREICPRFSVRLYPDGTARARIDEPARIPPDSGTPEECEARFVKYVETKWSFYLAGNKAAARSIAMEFFPEGYFIRRTGRTALKYISHALLMTVVILTAWSWYRRAPALSAADVASFYRGQFLQEYQNGFRSLPEIEKSMILYYKQPPSVMQIPGVRAAYLDLQKKGLDSELATSFSYKARELINGLEAGYLTIPILREWGFTRENIAALQNREWASLPPGVLTSKQALNQFDLDAVTIRVRLLQALGVVDLMDTALPDELVKRTHYENGTLNLLPLDRNKYRELGTTCQVACILTIFDRWDLTDRAAVTQRIIDWTSERGHASDGGKMYDLALGLIAVNATDKVPLSALAERIRPKNYILSKEPPWGIEPHNINEYAIKEILAGSSGRDLFPVR